MANTAGRKESLGGKMLEGVFVGLPLGFANGILAVLAKVKQKWVRWLVLTCLIALSLALIAGGRWIYRWVEFYSRDAAGNRPWGAGLKITFIYAAYNLIMMPLFLLLAYFNQQGRENFFKGLAVKKEPDTKHMRKHRLQSNKNRVYLGESFRSGKPIFLTNDQRLLHAEVVGSTGTGKTESVLLPLLAHDIAHGKGAIVIDGKGDKELLDRIHYLAVRKRKPEDFLFFSLAHPDKSNTYNPLLRGNATELKDKIVGSMPWSEEFYRRMAEQAALTILNVLVANGQSVRFRDLHAYLTDIDALNKLVRDTKDQALKDELGKMVNQFKNNPKFLSGLMADLYLMAHSEFSRLVDTDHPDIDLRDVYQRNRIVYFQLNLQGYADTAKRMGRIILQDIRTVSGYIQSHMRNSERHFFPVYIDDASSFLDVNFIDFLSKARASKLAITLLHQSLGDLIPKRDFSFQQQIIENTNVKIILRQDDPQSVEKLTKIGGTRRTTISTYQTEDRLLGKGFTGVGSIREGQTFRVEPDLIRGLKRGEAVVIWKSPSFHTDYVKLDFFGYPPFVGTFEPFRSPQPETAETRETKDPSSNSEGNGKKNGGVKKPAAPASDEPGESGDALARVKAVEREMRLLKLQSR